MLAIAAAVCFAVDFVLVLVGGGAGHVVALLLYAGLTLLALHLVVPVAVRRP